MTDKTKAGGMSATIENSLRRQAGTHEPKIRIIQAGSSYAGLANLNGGNLVDFHSDSITKAINSDWNSR